MPSGVPVKILISHPNWDKMPNQTMVRVVQGPQYYGLEYPIPYIAYSVATFRSNLFNNGELEAHLYKEHNSVRVLPLVSGRKVQAKTAARAQTTPWKRKRKWRPSDVKMNGVVLTIKNTVVVLRTWARQDPSVRY